MPKSEAVKLIPLLHTHVMVVDALTSLAPPSSCAVMSCWTIPAIMAIKEAEICSVSYRVS
jgi:hypothetical protein